MFSEQTTARKLRQALFCPETGKIGLSESTCIESSCFIWLIRQHIVWFNYNGQSVVSFLNDDKSFGQNIYRTVTAIGFTLEQPFRNTAITCSTS
ncbi:MAG: hypothetical protein LBK06_11260 [Planctomycetaceae bacterium]|jgi:hypothetical protein|nr:hypothetical protein [Planctomycetaceae bacterium]